MEKRKLGKTDLYVTELCFGALCIGPLQADTSPEEGGRLIQDAIFNGVNFIDTAEMYKTYEHIKHALKDYNGEVVIASKSSAAEYEKMERAVWDALTKMNREVIDIFHIHAAKETPQVFQEREGAFQCLLDYKAKGIIRYVGIATHNVDLVSEAAENDDVDIIFPLINKIGLGIVNGTPDDMLKAIKKAHAHNKGLYAMKALAGGNLITEFLEALDYVRSIPGTTSIALGMIKQEELDINLRVFNNEKLPEDSIPRVTSTKKPMILKNPCSKCLTCVEFCPNEAIEFAEDYVRINYDKCLLCGYCGPKCPRFAIRMI